MKMIKKEWRDTLLNKASAKQINLRYVQGLQIHHHQAKATDKHPLAGNNNILLFFITSRDSDHKRWLQFSLNAAQEPCNNSKGISMKTLIIGQNFFAKKHSGFITVALHTLSLHKEPILLNGILDLQWYWIMDKIESISNCDYQFRTQYLQELVLQAIHFLLKQITAKEKILLYISRLSFMTIGKTINYTQMFLNRE